ncbi:magnesium chelatase subunit D [Hydrogenophaga sp.]|uniref:magnesium chelatase subunit D n=1 Tax=Hydrogenophaga sp. TaxID=1904254 RepID=UPI00351DB9A7
MPSRLLGADAALVAALMAVDPVGLGGVALRSPAGPLRDDWLALLKHCLPETAPLLRVPLHASDAALLGGLDLAATLQAGRPIAQTGLLARCDGGVLLLAMAERVNAGVAALLAAVLDTHELKLERDGLTQRCTARVALVAFDEGANEEERLPATLLDRLAFHVALSPAAPGDEGTAWRRVDVEEARALMPKVVVPDAVIQALCAASVVWGVASMRAPLLALRAARAAAALAGLDEVDESHAALAARLVLAPRATRMPSQAPEPQEEQANTPEPAPPETDEAESAPAADSPPDQTPMDEEADHNETVDPKGMEDRLIEAVRAAIPAGLLAALALGQARQGRAATGGQSGAVLKNQNRGRPVGTRRGEPRSGARLHVLDTLRAAAPWQRLRGATQEPRRIQVRKQDFHVVRFRQNRPTTTLFVVDASGSAALHRLAEAKGAVELLLAECYVRRDKVAVLAFRGAGVEVLLPPTRSLARAKRALAALPGGGGTPLAQGIDAAGAMAQQIVRSGDTAVAVFLTDGRANIDRLGTPGRTLATADALQAAQAFALSGFTALLIDTSPQPADAARTLAAALAAAYIPLPHAGAAGLSQAVRLAQPAG